MSNGSPHIIIQFYRFVNTNNTVRGNKNILDIYYLIGNFWIENDALCKVIF